MRRKIETYPAEEGEEITIHGIWKSDREFYTTGRRVAQAIPTLPTLLNLRPGVVVPGKPLKQFASIHKDDGLILVFYPDNLNAVQVRTTGPAHKESRYHAEMNLQPTPEALNMIGFGALLKANLGNQ